MKLLSLLLVAVLAYLAGAALSPHTIVVERPVPMAVPDAQARFISIQVPAVDREGKGVMTRIDVTAFPGNGQVLTNIDKVLFWVDTQDSIRTARDVAANITGTDVNRWDLIYTIITDATVVEGPSAGAALTVATIAVLQNRSIRPDVMMSGTIERDGSIGSPGAVEAKARAAAAAGAGLFLIGPGWIGISGYEKVQTCELINGMEWCRTQYVPRKGTAMISEIEVREVRNIKEALELILI